MEFNFIEALATLGRNSAFRVANTARPPGSYVFNTILPERALPTYHISSGSMKVVGTMAGAVGMDSPYPPGGVISLSTFVEQTAKIANEVSLSEAVIRELQGMWQNLFVTGSLSPNFLANEALNFLQKVVIQAHLDRMEWMRGQALGNGLVDWTFNGINVLVDYGIPTANILTQRTDGNNDAYFDTGSLFWTDVREARRLLKNRVRAVIARSDLIDDIISNSVNNILVTAQTDTQFTVRRLVSRFGNTELSSDARDTLTLTAYDSEGEILNLSTPGATTLVPFMPAGKLLFIGNPGPNDFYRPGQGATVDPEESSSLGYTHLGPTVEGGGAPGRWADLYTPEQEPWSLHGRGVTNGLPVIENPNLIVIARSELSS